MKTHLLLSLFIFSFLSGSAQVTSPIMKANFGVEADLRANFFNNATATSGDDWFRVSIAGSGIGVIDTNGAAQLLADYMANPVTRRSTFSRLMSVYPYTVSSNKLLLDAVFHRDYHGNDSTIFKGGSNKNGMSPANWSSTGPGSIPDKNEFLDAMVHVRRDGPNPTDSLWMFGAVSLENTNGNRFFDFELYQTDIAFDFSTRKFIGYGPDAGHTTWQFDENGNITSPGDIVFTAEFSSSSLSKVEARIWVHKSSLDITPANFIWGANFDGEGNGAAYGYANILPKTPGDFYTGLQNTAATWAGPFQLVRASDALAVSYISGQFMEVSINLSKLGIEPGNIYGNYCGTPFRRVLIKSRSSTSFTSELKDFIAPFRIFDYPLEAYSFVQYFCERMPETTLTVSDPNPNFTYTWTTSNGNILGTNVGDSITIDAPGTYYVHMQKHIMCLADATDSITIFFDSICMVLPLTIRDLKVDGSDGTPSLSWTIDNNQYLTDIEIEYAFNNRDFLPMRKPRIKQLPGTVHYRDFDVPNEHLIYPTVYYRIKTINRYGQPAYSNIAVLKQKDRLGTAGIYPNPSRGKVFLTGLSASKVPYTFKVTDALGRNCGEGSLQVQQDKVPVQVNGFEKLPAGVYYLHFQALHETFKVIWQP